MGYIKKFFSYKLSVLSVLLLMMLIGLISILKAAEFPKDPNTHLIISRDDHARTEKIIKPGGVILIGDSHIKAIPEGQFFENSVNYGIGFQTSQNLFDNLELYQSLKNAKTIIIEIGTNDAIRGELRGFIARLDAIVSFSSDDAIIILNTIPPVSASALKKVPKKRIDTLNAAIKIVCQRHTNCRLFDLHAKLAQSGISEEELLNQDGIHLSPKAYEIWINGLQETLK